jgi:hypothetical protein
MERIQLSFQLSFSIALPNGGSSWLRLLCVRGRHHGDTKLGIHPHRGGRTVLNLQPHWLILLSAGRGDLLHHQHNRKRIGGTAKIYQAAFVNASGLTMETPMKPTRAIKAPTSSHFHARPRPTSRRAPITRGPIGNGTVLGWSRNTSSAMKKNKVARINKRLMMRAIHRMTLVQAGRTDDKCSII